MNDKWYSYQCIKVFHLGNLFMIPTGLRTRHFFLKKNKNWKNTKNCSKIAKKSLFFPLFGEKSFLTYGLGEKEALRPTPKWNTRFYLAFSIRAYTADVYTQSTDLLSFSDVVITHENM